MHLMQVVLVESILVVVVLMDHLLVVVVLVEDLLSLYGMVRDVLDGVGRDDIVMVVVVLLVESGALAVGGVAVDDGYPSQVGSGGG